MEDNENERFLEFDWIIFGAALFPFIMIGSYFMGWISFFRICAIPIMVILLWGVVEQFKNARWALGIYHLVLLLIFLEIGYLLMDTIVDGICMGMYVGLIASFIDNIVRQIIIKYKTTNKKDDFAS